MRAWAVSATLVLPLVALLACSGRYESLDPPGSGSSSGGRSGSGSTSSAGVSGSSSGGGASRDGGSDGSSAAAQACPPSAAIMKNGACDVSPQMACPSDMDDVDCYGRVVGTLMCSCDAGAWVCPETHKSECTFDGSAGCPLPASIQSGMPCDLPGAACPGNPTLCNGQTHEDAYECDDGVWVDVAHAMCDADGG